MKAMRIEDDWGLESLRLVDLAETQPGPRDAVVAMRAISINPRDRVMAMGGYGRQGGDLPLIPLCDGAGDVVAVGAEVTEIALGDRVAPTCSRTWLTGLRGPDAFKGAHGGPLDGTCVERMAVPASALVRLPDHLSYAEGATLPCAAVTAWNAVVTQGDLRADQTVLLQGTGAVSLFSLQFAKLKGATVIMTSSSDQKLARAKDLGAAHLINYKETTDWDKTVKGLTAGKGVDLVVNVAGGGTLDRSIKSVKASGTVSLIGVLAGRLAELDLGRVVTRNVRLQGVTVGSREMFAEMVGAIGRAAMHPVIDPTPFEFEDVASALNRLPQGKHFGKIVCEL